MSDTTTDDPDALPEEPDDTPPEEPSDGPGGASDPSDDPEAASDPSDDPEAANAFADADDAREYLLKGALVVLALVGVIATFQFYTSAVAAINEWVAPDYRPVFRAAFNLVVVLLAGIGISLVLRELSRSTGK